MHAQSASSSVSKLQRPFRFTVCTYLVTFRHQMQGSADGKTAMHRLRSVAHWSWWVNSTGQVVVPFQGPVIEGQRVVTQRAVLKTNGGAHPWPQCSPCGAHVKSYLRHISHQTRTVLFAATLGNSPGAASLVQVDTPCLKTHCRTWINSRGFHTCFIAHRSC